MFENKDEFKAEFIKKVHAIWGKSLDSATDHEKYIALSGVIRDYVSINWIKTKKEYNKDKGREIYYFSIEFLLGSLLDCNMINAGVKKLCAEGLADLNINIDDVLNEEPDAGLGNGGLGRLAACFLDSFASMGLPAHGCGMRYRYGLFKQKIVNNNQVELPDNWLKDLYPWEFRRTDKAVEVHLKGHAYCVAKSDGSLKSMHEDYFTIKAVPYDIPVIGYQNNTVNTLRLWSAELVKDISDLDSYTKADFDTYITNKNWVQRISKILYPDDSTYDGRELRLTQQYFFVSAGVQSIFRHFKNSGYDTKDFAEKVGIHINDTHPAVAIPELMRILIDEEELDWNEAWEITRKTMSYTNHTILPEALEKWPVDMFKNLLPRIYMIIEEINRRFVLSINEKYGNYDKANELAILQDGQIHMARLAVIGSYSVNGVAAIHTEILKDYAMAAFHQFYPGKFNNKTNGITHRRWLIKANPKLADLISEAISPLWIKRPEQLRKLAKFAADSAFQDKTAKIKLENKQKLAKYIQEKNGVKVDVNSIFDIQIKRIHSYKRQIMNALHIMDLYNRLRENPNLDITPRTFIFGGKAAPGYYMAKETIKLINTLGEKINNDKSIKDKLKVIFVENYGVSLGEMLFPAADVSEQISTASKEASGTGNMKFMMNGAITIGTLDGANVEIRNAVGEDNIIIFGLTAKEVLDYHHFGNYRAWDIYHENPRVKMVVEQLVNGFFDPENESFNSLYDYLLLANDEFFVLKDFLSYSAAHNILDERYRDKKQWQTSSIINIAHSGQFSSDRTIDEYAKEIWKIKPILVP